MKRPREAFNYAMSLIEIERFEEAKFLLRKTIPVGRRVFGENHEDALKMKWIYARSLYEDPAATIRRSPRGRNDARGRGADRASACSVARTHHRGD